MKDEGRKSLFLLSFLLMSMMLLMLIFQMQTLVGSRSFHPSSLIPPFVVSCVRRITH
jgi:hypothetical protein